MDLARIAHFLTSKSFKMDNLAKNGKVGEILSSSKWTDLRKAAAISLLDLPGLDPSRRNTSSRVHIGNVQQGRFHAYIWRTRSKKRPGYLVLKHASDSGYQYDTKDALYFKDIEALAAYLKLKGWNK